MVDEDRIPDVAEVNAIASAISDQYKLTIWLMAAAGLRLSEALAFSAECKRDGLVRVRRQVSSKANRGDCKTRLVKLKARTEGGCGDRATVLDRCWIVRSERANGQVSAMA